MDAVRPKGESFIRFIAWDSEVTGMIPMMGPKVSWVISDILWVTFVRTGWVSYACA